MKSAQNAGRCLLGPLREAIQMHTGVEDTLVQICAQILSSLEPWAVTILYAVCGGLGGIAVTGPTLS